MIGALATYWREAVIVALLVGLVGQQARLADERAAHARTKATNAEVLRDLAEKSRKAYEAVLRDNEQRAVANAAVDKKHTKELNDERAKTQALADAVRAGRQRVLVRASCPAATGPGVPEAPSAGRVADAAGPRLDAEAERNYFGLRDDIAVARSQIAGLQDYITSVCLPATAR
ncbi:endopeptidase [Acidovorax phage ACPWH]|nr:endopeptidase [Acidovorax phage ACPWH]QXV72258.1 Rz lysis protein [Acidovorax phage ACF1]